VRDISLGIAKRKLVDKVILANWGGEKNLFNYNELLFVLQELNDEEGKKYFDDKTTRRGHEVYHKFVELLLYRNLANYDSMILITADKGMGKSSAAIMIARYWCQLLGIKFNPARHIAYNNADMMNKIDNLNKFEPIICLSSNTKINIKFNDKQYQDSIFNLLNKQKYKNKNYEILTLNEEKNIFEYQKPKDILKTGYDYLYEIELENGIKIKATKEHLFLTKNGSYKKLCDLTDGDELILNTKKCVVCNKEFFNVKHNALCCSGGCSKKLSEKRVIDKHDKILKYQKEYYNKNQKILLQKEKEKRDNNKEIYSARSKAEYQKHKEQYKKYNDEYYKNNKQIMLDLNKKWVKENINYVNEYRAKYHAKRMINDLNYHLRHNLSTRIADAVKQQNFKKTNCFIKLLGCNYSILKQHLEKQFKPGMSWSNYGNKNQGWHVDHIKPCASFDLIKEEEQRKCFHYTNLQPLWAKDNLKKGAKI
jgi:hypothetical protein